MMTLRWGEMPKKQPVLVVKVGNQGLLPLDSRIKSPAVINQAVCKAHRLFMGIEVGMGAPRPSLSQERVSPPGDGFPPGGVLNTDPAQFAVLCG